MLGLDLCLYVDIYDFRILIYDLQTTPTYNHIRSLHIYSVWLFR